MNSERSLESACIVIETLAESLDDAMRLYEDTIKSLNEHLGLELEAESAVITGQATAYKAREFVAKVKQTRGT